MLAKNSRASVAADAVAMIIGESHPETGGTDPGDDDARSMMLSGWCWPRT